MSRFRLNQSGLTLIEVLCAAGILATLELGWLFQSRAWSKASRGQVTYDAIQQIELDVSQNVASIAQNKLDQLLTNAPKCTTVDTAFNASFTTIFNTGISLTVINANTPITIDGVTYTPSTIPPKYLGIGPTGGSSAASNALNRCLTQQTAGIPGTVNITNESGFYFCLLITPTPGGIANAPVLRMQPLFAEFTYTFLNLNTGTTMNCGAIPVPVPGVIPPYIGQLYYTFYWTNPTFGDEYLAKERTGLISVAAR
jgi:hypothetical protein